MGGEHVPAVSRHYGPDAAGESLGGVGGVAGVDERAMVDGRDDSRRKALMAWSSFLIILQAIHERPVQFFALLLVGRKHGWARLQRLVGTMRFFFEPYTLQ